MGCRDDGPGRTKWEEAQRELEYQFRNLVTSLLQEKMSDFTLEEALLLTKMNVRDAYEFRPSISDEDLALLEAAARRILKNPPLL